MHLPVPTDVHGVTLIVVVDHEHTNVLLLFTATGKTILFPDTTALNKFPVSSVVALLNITGPPAMCHRRNRTTFSVHIRISVHLRDGIGEVRTVSMQRVCVDATKNIATPDLHTAFAAT